MRYSGHGIQLQMSDMSASPTFTAIAQIENIQPPGWTRGTEPVPTHDDAAGTGVTKLADALYDGGQVTLTVLYDPADPTQQALDDARSATDPTDFRVVYPDAASTQVDFSAWVVSFTPQGVAANTGKLRADVTLEVTGGDAAA